jgi:hypothetical protein
MAIRLAMERLAQPLNADLPIVVTLVGMVMELRLLHMKNA